MPLRVVFFGTPAFAVPTLTALASSPHSVVGVVTQPDRPRGRGMKVVPSPVKAESLSRGIPVLQPDRLRDDGFLAAFDALEADLAVVAAYGKILPQVLIDRPRLGMINVHASLLPRWRGAAPIHRAILAGDRETGITIMRVVLALDAGPMLARVVLPIGPDETSAELEARLAAAGASLLVETVSGLERGAIEETSQDDSRATYAKRLERADSRIDWSAAAAAIHDQIRGLHPWPLAAAMLGGQRLRLIRSRVPSAEGAPGTSTSDPHRRPTAAGRVPDASSAPGTIVSVADALGVATGDGIVEITQVQPEGRPVMTVRDWLNGRRVSVGDRFEPLPEP